MTGHPYPLPPCHWSLLIVVDQTMIHHPDHIGEIWSFFGHSDTFLVWFTGGVRLPILGQGAGTHHQILPPGRGTRRHLNIPSKTHNHNSENPIGSE